MEDLTLEKGHPMPEWIPQRHRWKDLFHRSIVGDSFIVPDAQARESARAAARVYNVKVSSRIQEDGKIRIWVVKKEEAESSILTLPPLKTSEFV